MREQTASGVGSSFTILGDSRTTSFAGWRSVFPATRYCVMKFVQKFAFPLLVLACAAPLSAKAETIHVVLDRATILRLPEKVATIVIGNPSIADGSLQAGGLLVVTGKGYGDTNLLALDRRGDTLAEYIVTVTAPKDDTKMTIYRGVERETWSCAP